MWDLQKQLEYLLGQPCNMVQEHQEGVQTAAESQLIQIEQAILRRTKGGKAGKERNQFICFLEESYGQKQHIITFQGTSQEKVATSVVYASDSQEATCHRPYINFVILLWLDS